MKRRPVAASLLRSDLACKLALPFAFAQEVKIAHVSALPEFESAQPFRRDQWPALEAFRPNILIGYSFDFERLAARIREGSLTLASVDRAIFVLTDCGCLPVSDQLRDQLWRLFGVPAFELIVAPGCRLLASECELHQGWHLEDEIRAYFRQGELVYDTPRVSGIHTGFGGEIDLQPCDCCRPAVRLQKLVPYLPMDRRSRLAAIA